MTSPARYSRFQQIHAAVRTLAVHHDLALALADLDHCDPLFLRAAKSQQDARAGLPGAQAYDAPSVTGGGSTSSAPERLAMQEDRTQADRDLLDRLLRDLWTDVRGVILEPAQVCRRITTNTLALRRLVDRWTPHQPTDKQRREVTAANVEATECKLTRDNLGLWAEVHRTSDLWSLLPEPAPVGRWVWRFAKDRGRLPTPMEWQHHRSKDDDLRSQSMASVKR